MSVWGRMLKAAQSVLNVQGYGDAVSAARYAEVRFGGPEDGLAIATAGVELLARGMASAEPVEAGPNAEALTPEVLALIARECAIRGEAVFLIDLENGALALRPCASWDVHGGRSRSSWRYDLRLATPDGSERERVLAAQVFHVRVGERAERPWRGVSPLASSRSTLEVARQMEAALQREFALPVYDLIAVPDGYMGRTPQEVREGIERLDSGKSRTYTQTYRVPPGATPSAGQAIGVHRVGPEPSPTYEPIRGSVGHDVLGALGIPLPLIAGGDSGAQRESLRRFFALTVQPLGRRIIREGRRALDLPAEARFAYAELVQADLAPRARAAGTLAGLEGVETDEALRMVGLR